MPRAIIQQTVQFPGNQTQTLTPSQDVVQLLSEYENYTCDIKIMVELSMNMFVENQLYITQGGATSLFVIPLDGNYQSLSGVAQILVTVLPNCVGFDQNVVAYKECINFQFDRDTQLMTQQPFLGKLLGMTPNTTYISDAQFYIRNTNQCFLLQAQLINVFCTQCHNQTYSSKSSRYNQIGFMYNQQVCGRYQIIGTDSSIKFYRNSINRLDFDIKDENLNNCYLQPGSIVNFDMSFSPDLSQLEGVEAKEAAKAQRQMEKTKSQFYSQILNSFADLGRKLQDPYYKEKEQKRQELKQKLQKQIVYEDKNLEKPIENLQMLEQEEKPKWIPEKLQLIEEDLNKYQLENKNKDIELQQKLQELERQKQQVKLEEKELEEKLQNMLQNNEIQQINMPENIVQQIEKNNQQIKDITEQVDNNNFKQQLKDKLQQKLQQNEIQVDVPYEKQKIKQWGKQKIKQINNAQNNVLQEKQKIKIKQEQIKMPMNQQELEMLEEKYENIERQERRQQQQKMEEKYEKKNALDIDINHMLIEGKLHKLSKDMKLSDDIEEEIKQWKVGGGQKQEQNLREGYEKQRDEQLEKEEKRIFDLLEGV